MYISIHRSVSLSKYICISRLLHHQCPEPSPLSASPSRSLLLTPSTPPSPLSPTPTPQSRHSKSKQDLSLWHRRRAISWWLLLECVRACALVCMCVFVYFMSHCVYSAFSNVCVCDETDHKKQELKYYTAYVTKKTYSFLLTTRRRDERRGEETTITHSTKLVPENTRP